MKKFLSEFKTFIARGNVMDMAVGVIVGGAFSTIVNSFINDLMMPVLGIFLGGVDFSSWVIGLPNLFGGEAHATGRMHRLDHLIRQLAQLVVNNRHGLRLFAQHLLPVLVDL